MKKHSQIGIFLCLIAVACFTTGCLVINVEKNEAPETEPPAKEINVEEVAPQAN